MRTKKSHEGYLMIDDRASGGTLRERSVLICKHCQTDLDFKTSFVIRNPFRTRERAYCQKCDHYICDGCAIISKITGRCRTFNQIADEIQEAAARGRAQLRRIFA